MEASKGDRVNSVYVTEKKHRLSLPANTYHVNKGRGGEEKLWPYLSTNSCSC